MRAAEEGWVGDEIAEEFRGLGLVFLPARLGGVTHRRAAKDRLVALEEYFSGAVIADLPGRPVTAAHRVFFRQVGLNPEVDRTPVELLCYERLWRGRFVSRGLLHDALLATALETEIPVRALPAADVLGPLGITAARPGERLPDEQPLITGALVVADAAKPLALLFGAPPLLPRADEVLLFAPVVPGVATATATEALWLAAQLLGSA